MVSMTVTGSFANAGMIKNELSVNILKWTVKAGKSGKLSHIHQPTVVEHGANAYVPEAEYHQDVWAHSGRAVYNKPTMDDQALARQLGAVESAALEETNMYQTDSRDLAADREAEEYADTARTYGQSSVSSADALFKENEKLEKCREGLDTYGYCAWCDAPIGNPNKLWRHYLDHPRPLGLNT